jgi:hypothetical protein
MTEEEKANWLNIHDAAKLAGRGESTIRALAKAGKIRRWLVSDRIKLYHRDDLEKLGPKQKPGPKPKAREQGQGEEEE